jgi:hypothetical protein
MLLSTFLECISRTKQLPQGIVFCFSGSEYPLTFFYHFILFLKKNGLVIESLNCSNGDVVAIKALLSTMSFFDSTIYYLANFFTLPPKKQQELLEYMHQYAGPHRVLLFSDNVSNSLITTSDKGMRVIALPEEIAPRDYGLVRFLINDNVVQSRTAFSSRLAVRLDSLSLDSACLFAHYELLVGKEVESFFSQWMFHLIEPTNSLFTLSQYFFSKKNKQFFRQWSTISELYLSPFWVTFWADQVWRAYVFCDLMKQKKHAEAKKAQYKLPFSFINRDWSTYTLDELRNAHHFLSSLDFRVKNGGSEIGLEHFYAQFFDNKFQ